MNGFLANAAQYGIPAVFVALGVWLVQRNIRKQTSVDASQRQIDNLQEDRESLYKQMDDARTEFVREKEALQEQQRRAFVRIENLERRERITLDYVYQLRQHIDERRMPPPPTWPTELTRHE